jgi:pyruvate kinase
MRTSITGKVLPLHLISVGVEASFEYLNPAAIFVRTDSGASARRLAGFRLPVWTVAISPGAKTAQDLLFSSGVIPVHLGAAGVLEQFREGVGEASRLAGRIRHPDPTAVGE